MQKIIALCLLAGAAAAVPELASAGTITFSIANETPPINAATGGIGSFDVVVSEPGGGDHLYQYQFDLTLQQGSSNIQFIGNNGVVPSPAGTSGIEGTVAPYVFAGNSDISGSGDVSVFPGPNGNEVTVTDEVLNNATAPALSSTALALARVYFYVPAGTTLGDYTVTFNQDNPNTDPFADWVNTISNADTSEISPGAAINGSLLNTLSPEPSSVVLLLLGAAGLIAVRRRPR